MPIISQDELAALRAGKPLTPQPARAAAAPAPSAAAGAPTATKPSDPTAPTHPTTSFMRGAVSGATLGFNDEAAGAIGALLSAAGGARPNESLADAYRRARDATRAADAKAFADNPLTYGAGKVVGGAGAAVALPGGLVTQSALSGAGNSDADTPGGVVRDAATGALAGKVLQGAGGLASAVTNKVVPQVAKDVGSSTLADAAGLATKAGATGVGGLLGGPSGAATAAMASQTLHKYGPDIVSKAVNDANGPVATAAKSAYDAAKVPVANAIEGAGKAAGTAIAASQKAVPTAAGAVAITAAPATQGILDWVKQTLGFDTPAGQQAIPAEVRQQQQQKADDAANAGKDGRISRSVPNVISENGKRYILTDSGDKVEVQ